MIESTVNIRNCARCGLDHDAVTLLRLTNPVAPPDYEGLMWDHWAPCPHNGQPILVRTISEPLPDDNGVVTVVGIGSMDDGSV